MTIPFLSAACPKGRRLSRRLHLRLGWSSSRYVHYSEHKFVSQEQMYAKIAQEPKAMQTLQTMQKQSTASIRKRLIDCTFPKEAERKTRAPVFSPYPLCAARRAAISSA